MPVLTTYVFIPNNIFIPEVIEVAGRWQVKDKLVVNHFEQRLRWPVG